MTSASFTDRPVVGARRRSLNLAGLAIALTTVLTVVLTACVPTSPPPSVRPQPAERGKVADVVVAPSAGCARTVADPLPIGRSTVSIATAQGVRTAQVDVPADVTQPRPLVLSLHPFLLGPEQWDGYSGLAAAGTARGDIVVTPLGSGPGPRWAVPGGLETGADDLGFLSALLDHVEDSTCVDRNREFAVGFSAGAAMAQALSCTMPWRIAGIVASGGANLTDLCPDSPGTDVMILHGSADPIAPTTGSQVVFAPPTGLSVDSVVAANASRAGCDTTPLVSQPFGSVVVDRYQGCDDGHRVQYWREIGAGHTWAGATTDLFDFVTGPTNQEFSATEQALNFFDSYEASTD